MRITAQDRFLQDIIEKAGDTVRRNFGKVTTGKTKSARGDIVTKADFISERIIIEAIRQKYPYHHILSEEAGELPGRGEYTWIIDPLDGTSNFAMQIPLFCVIIALAKGPNILQAGIYDPLHNELFYARRGQGAYLNGKPIHVSAKTDLDEMGIIVSNIRLRSALEQFAHWRSLFSLYTTHEKKYGSAGISLAYVAAGRVDAYIVGGAYPWDIAAGALLAAEAGAKVTTVNNKKWSWRDWNQEIVVTNPKLHRNIMQLIEE